ncbi:MAG: 50S ribosomal protein L21 [Candidatus Doudnabacteria bacterium RIFCSPHIGHO2_01_FULL_50_11]|uniref:Large ribosomal subunit protein bL21 n=1 Tax=Candidatus Doudnabacteria bacterium RIFCSPHIGHO2_01_FULL_50_11 TaxID=1817828 RepID=A0A1F5PH79_9BACT|nr:MAG: 50S ribosomal protein L21 [Candidatus Doudnabacteria bacterium RIFCSPHIGHO2_01_FULL_50_11]HLC44816.1 50S ribosomal protein L21 [Patescibacteria group bacterium]
MQFAVIERDGKQYLVKQGDRLKFDPIAAEPNSSVIFDKVLIRGSAESALIGKPYVEGATVEAKVLSHGRADKVLVMKYHNKTRYRRKRGHRQPYTEIQIVKV